MARGNVTSTKVLVLNNNRIFCIETFGRELARSKEMFKRWNIAG